MNSKPKPARRSSRLPQTLGLSQTVEFTAPRRDLLETRRSILKKLSTRIRQENRLCP